MGWFFLWWVIVLFASMKGYLYLAQRFNIIDHPNERSSHQNITIRGGGIIFPIAVILWFLRFGQPYPWFATGLVLIAIISFLDDRFTLNTRPRLAVHLGAVFLLLWQSGFATLPGWAWLAAFILVIGWLNTFNFMDGINGITVFYALSVILPIWFLNQDLALVQDSLLYVIGISLLVFAWFNARKRARTFAGDVGSVSMGFVLAFLLIQLILATGQWYWVLLVSVYGVDSVITILQRLQRRENIFEAHRTHLYQYLANELGRPHVSISLAYALIQLAISALTVFAFRQNWSPWWGGVALLLLALLYILLKRKVLMRVQNRDPKTAQT